MFLSRRLVPADFLGDQNGIVHFYQGSGRKAVRHKEAEQAVSPEEKTRLNQAAAQAIFDHINGLGLKWSNLMVSFKSGQVSISSDADQEKNRERSSWPPATCRASITSRIT